MYEAIQLVGISDLGILGVLMLLISSLVSVKNFRKRDVNQKKLLDHGTDGKNER